MLKLLHREFRFWLSVKNLLVHYVLKKYINNHIFERGQKIKNITATEVKYNTLDL